MAGLLILLHDLGGGLEDRAGLHGRDLGIGHAQTDAAVTHHRVAFLQRVGALHELGVGDADGLRELELLFLRVGHEFMQRRIEETDGDRETLHGLQGGQDVLLDVGEEFLQGGDAFCRRAAEDHLAEGEERLLVAAVEHVLGAEEADALGAERAGLGGVFGGVGIGADAELFELVDELHELLELFVFAGVDGLQGAGVHIAAGAVQAEHVAFLERLLADLEGLLDFVDLDVGGADDAALAPAAADERRVAGHAAARGEDAGGGAHAVDVFRIGLFTDHDAGEFLLVAGHGVLGVEDNLTDRAAGTGGEALHDDLGGLFGLLVEDRVEEFVELSRSNAHDSGLLVDELFLEHVHRHVQGGGAGALADAALEHEELLVLDGELDVEHVVVVAFELVADADEFLVGLREHLFHRGQVLVLLVLGLVVQRERGAGAGDDVFALGVDEPFAVELVVAGGGVAGERHAGGGGVAHVAEDHALDVDGGAPVVRDALDAAVGDGLLAVPALEDGADRALELEHGIVGEFALQDLLDADLEVLAELLQVGHGEVGVALVAFGLLQVVEHGVELLADGAAFGGLDALGLFHDHVGVHHDEAAVGVVHEAFVAAGALDEAVDGAGGETDVQDGLHHAGHGFTGAGTAGDEERVLRIAEGHAHDLFDFCESGLDLGVEAGGILLAVGEIIDAAFGGDGESGGDRKSEFRHFGEVSAFAAEQFIHGGVAVAHALAEQIDVLFRGRFLHSKSFLTVGLRCFLASYFLQSVKSITIQYTDFS